MRFLCLVLAVFLLVSLAAPGYGQVRKYCPKVGYCSSKCSKADVWSLSSDCKFYCCLPPGWKGK
ncbi:cygnin [Anser cygnoides]|uniref:Cygnin n=2 Tax=Anser TaxID=8842 RepID=A0A8B9DBA6_ANSCY|nr:cygnin [Anser cygnoides]XP_035419597.1 cygnin [Cygnus atratus]XP_035419598.1 cygnin [Cygnus atratus]XP_040406598.1 cygnin [Cygnus olor]XP_040406599.1 cygnin [Cygnus olor]XP_047935233.1 cygnin [Anser cygnoides]XP_047935234.1 cygnin [Anser cygnoides]XP_047935236.1 cygnin [Anser cygnoides]XP_047935237.1 cygnin [Anser cygnoides]XP_047935269.1 cygnin [Anser cygnoides]